MGCCVDINQSQEDPYAQNNYSTLLEKPKILRRQSSIRFNKKQIVEIKHGKLTNWYRIVSKLDSKGQGNVYEARQLQTKQAVAIKRITHLAKISQIDSFYQEVRRLIQLDHPYIIKIYEVIDDGTYLYVVTELCYGNSIFKGSNRIGDFSETQVAYYVKQMLSVINYCHSQGVVHGKIDPRKFVFQSQEEENIKLVNINTAAFREKENLEVDMRSLRFASPEAIQGRVTEKSDIWSIGVIMWALISGEYPFSAQNTWKLMRKIQTKKHSYRGIEWRSISPDVRLVLDKMLSKAPDRRLSASELLQLPWFQNVTTLDKNKGKYLMSQWTLSVKENPLQKAVKYFIQNQYATSRELKDLREVFQALDKNNDGKLCLQELMQGVQQLGIKLPPEDIRIIFDQSDLDDSGYIEYTEFIAAAFKFETAMYRSRLEKAFQLIDIDGNGTLSVEEIEKFAGVKDDFLSQWIREADENGDGVISCEEFVNAIMEIGSKNLTEADRA